MGRIIFLSAVALLAYRYIAKSNQKNQVLNGSRKGVEVLPPTEAASPSAPRGAVAPAPQQKLIPVASRAVESEPAR